MTLDTPTLRRQLRNVRTRPATLDAVAAMGPSAQDAVVPLLHDRHEGVRWCAIRLLAEIGDERAVEPLIACLENEYDAADATRALQSITGADLGRDAAAWRRWLRTPAAQRDQAEALAMTDDALVREAVAHLPVQISGGDSEYIATVTLPDGGRQDVWIRFTEAHDADRPIVQLITPCGGADPHRYETALIRNMTILYGAFAIASIEGQRSFVIVNNHLRATVQPGDIAESIMSLARHAGAPASTGIGMA